MDKLSPENEPISQERRKIKQLPFLFSQLRYLQFQWFFSISLKAPNGLFARFARSILLQFKSFINLQIRSKTLELIKHDVSSLAGVSGQVFVDENGDRTITLQMRNFHNGEMVRVANYFRHLEELEFTNTTTIWPGGSVTAPLGRPECGFNGEFCSSPGMMMPIFPV